MIVCDCIWRCDSRVLFTRAIQRCNVVLVAVFSLASFSLFTYKIFFRHMAWDVPTTIGGTLLPMVYYLLFQHYHRQLNRRKTEKDRVRETSAEGISTPDQSTKLSLCSVKCSAKFDYSSLFVGFISFPCHIHLIFFHGSLTTKPSLYCNWICRSIIIWDSAKSSRKWTWLLTSAVFLFPTVPQECALRN